MKALQFGVNPDDALKIKYAVHYKALILLGKDKAVLASQFDQDSQIQALEYILKNVQNPEDALKFKIHTMYSIGINELKALQFGVNPDNALKIRYTIHYKALTLLGKDKAVLALQFDQDSQIQALEYILKNGQNPDDALKFKMDSKGSNELKALQFGVSPDDALKVKYGSQYEALEFLGKEKNVLAIEFVYNSQVNALKYGLDTTNALRFTKNSQFNALKHLGENKVEDALKVVEDSQFIAIQHGLSIEDALNFRNVYQAAALDNKSITDFHAALSIDTYIKLLCLKIDNNISDAVRCESNLQLSAYEKAKEAHYDNIDEAFSITDENQYNDFSIQLTLWSDAHQDL